MITSHDIARRLLAGPEIVILAPPSLFRDGGVESDLRFLNSHTADYIASLQRKIERQRAAIRQLEHSAFGTWNFAEQRPLTKAELTVFSETAPPRGTVRLPDPKPSLLQRLRNLIT